MNLQVVEASLINSKTGRLHSMTLSRCLGKPPRVAHGINVANIPLGLTAIGGCGTQLLVGRGVQPQSLRNSSASFCGNHSVLQSQRLAEDVVEQVRLIFKEHDEKGEPALNAVHRILLTLTVIYA